VKHLEASGQLAIVGRIQEQHPQRTRLFMQWHQMDWPVVIDPLNLLEHKGIPIVAAIDEHGIAHEATRADFVPGFMQHALPPGAVTAGPMAATRPDLVALEAQTVNGDAVAWGEYGAALYLWEGIDRIDEAVEAFRRAVALEPEQGRWHFRLGVCLRRRYDSDYQRGADFQRAVDAWVAALALDPNQYIWRRRIQQYGPRLDKPYPFYDWVHEAREAIRARGEVPIDLDIEPAGAEIAEPLGELINDPATVENPDPEGQIWRDDEGLVRMEVVAVPAAVTPGASARIHLAFRPDPQRRVHWSNEVDDLALWVEAPPGWELERQLHRIGNPREPVSGETRRLDFELKCNATATPGEATLTAFALYYICEYVDGTCLYRRQDIRLTLRVTDHQAGAGG